MCKEDIRLARSASAKSPVTGGSPNSLMRLLPVNPNRYSLSASIRVADPQTSGVSVALYTLVDGKRFPLAQLTNWVSFVNLNLVDVGTALTGEIRMETEGVDDPDAYYLGETSFDQSLESI